MKVFHYSEVELKGSLRWLITEETGAKNFVMRLAENNRTGPIVPHIHPWEHGIFVLEGEGVISDGISERKIKEGDVIYIPPNEPHGIKKIGEKTLKFICIIPAGVDLNKIQPVKIKGK